MGTIKIPTLTGAKQVVKQNSRVVHEEKNAYSKIQNNNSQIIIQLTQQVVP